MLDIGNFQQAVSYISAGDFFLNMAFCLCGSVSKAMRENILILVLLYDGGIKILPLSINIIVLFSMCLSAKFILLFTLQLFIQLL